MNNYKNMPNGNKSNHINKASDEEFKQFDEMSFSELFEMALYDSEDFDFNFGDDHEECAGDEQTEPTEHCEHESQCGDYDLDFEKNDWGDEYRNAPGFRILRGVFLNNKEGAEQFNAISNLAKDDIIQVMRFLMGDDDVSIDKELVGEKLALLTEKQQEIVVKKAQKTSVYLNKKTKKNRKSNEYKFTDMIKQVCLNLVYGTEKSGPIRYSRDGTDYAGDGLYSKMHLSYDPFIFITDAMYLLGLAENDIGHYDQEFQSGTQSRMWATDT